MNSLILHTGRTHNHVLEGDFDIIDKDVVRVRSAVLRHLKPDGTPSGEHGDLPIKEGEYTIQIAQEFNPFTETYENVFD